MHKDSCKTLRPELNPAKDEDAQALVKYLLKMYSQVEAKLNNAMYPELVKKARSLKLTVPNTDETAKSVDEILKSALQ